MFLEVMLMFLEVIKCSWRLYNVPGGYTNKGRHRAARAAKKGKSSKFNPRDDEQLKSGPNLKVWSHEGFIHHPKIAQ